MIDYTNEGGFIGILCLIFAGFLCWLVGYFAGRRETKKRFIKLLPNSFLQCKNCAFYVKPLSDTEGICIINDCRLDRSDTSKACKDFEIKLERINHG